MTVALALTIIAGAIAYAVIVAIACRFMAVGLGPEQVVVDVFDNRRVG